jgi:hypothetical protein
MTMVHTNNVHVTVELVRGLPVVERALPRDDV